MPRSPLEKLISSEEAAIAALEASLEFRRKRLGKLREAMQFTDTQEVLHKRLRSSIVNDVNMHADHRLAISKGHKGTDQAFKKAIGAKGYTQNGLAKAIRVNRAVLSLHRQKLRRIPLSRAQAIEKLTGWPADAKHWPCGIVTDGE